MPKAKKSKKGRFAYYAVAKGKDGVSGVYSTWNETSKQTNGVSKVKYRGCNTLGDLEDFFDEHDVAMDTVIWGEGTRFTPHDAPKSTKPSRRVSLSSTVSFNASIDFEPATSTSTQSPTGHASIPPALASALAAAASALVQVTAALESGCSSASSSQTPAPPAHPADATQPVASGSRAGAATSAEVFATLLRLRDKMDSTLATLSDRNAEDASLSASLPKEDIVATLRQFQEEMDTALLALGDNEAQ